MVIDNSRNKEQNLAADNIPDDGSQSISEHLPAGRQRNYTPIRAYTHSTFSCSVAKADTGCNYCYQFLNADVSPG